MRGRGLHLDDDVPIITPVVQQTGQPADAAEAHMSMGRMELISNAAAKMMNVDGNRSASEGLKSRPSGVATSTSLVGRRVCLTAHSHHRYS